MNKESRYDKEVRALLQALLLSQKPPRDNGHAQVRGVRSAAKMIVDCYDAHAWIDGHWRHATGAECPTFERTHPSPGLPCQHDGVRDHYSETHWHCPKCDALIPYEITANGVTTAGALSIDRDGCDYEDADEIIRLSGIVERVTALADSWGMATVITGNPRSDAMRKLVEELREAMG